MHPIIFKIGNFTVYSYGFLLALSFLICIYLVRKDAQGNSFNPDSITDLCFWVLISGIIGSRIFYIFLNLDYFITRPMDIFKLHQGGLAWYGGLVFSIPVAIIFLKLKKLPILKTLDLLSPYVALGQAIGRVGCFLNGCCFGKPISWGTYFTLHNARLHPTQLYSFFNLLIIFIILKRLRNLGMRNGQIFLWYLTLASLERFIVEFFRGDSLPILWNLTIFQIISIIIFFSSLYANLYIQTRRKR